MIREEESGKDRLVAGCVAAASLATNAALLSLIGIQRGADTDRYVEGASDLLSGRTFRGPAGWVYLGYNGLVAAAEAVGVGQPGVIAVQFVMAACAAMALYTLGRDLGGRTAGILAAGFFILDYDIARWHLYVLTDSLYISLVVLAAWAAHRAVGRSARAYLAAAGVLVLTALVRPNGWVMIPIVGVYWIFRSTLPSRQALVAAVAVILVCGAGAAAFAVYQFGGQRPTSRASWAGWAANRQRLPFAGVMTIRGRLDPTRMPMRLLAELGHIQPTFSLRHKIFVVATLALVYPLAIIGFMRSRGAPLSRLLAAVVVCHLLIVSITFSDRDGRYLLYVFPLLVVFAAHGAAGTIRR